MGLNQLIGEQRYLKLTEFTKLASVTGSVQLLVQVFSFISGILVIRLLPTDEYAMYTVANTMLGTINLLSDGGITTGVMAQGGKVWQDKEKLGKVLMTGLGLRRKFAAGSFLLSVPILIYLLNNLGASWLTILLIVLSLIPAFYAALIDSLLEIVPKLHQSILPLQKNQLNVSILRLAFSGLTLFLFPFTAIALVAAGIPRFIGNVKLRKIAAVHADTTQKPDAQIQKNILEVVKRVLPGTIYFCLSGQVTIWLISAFGEVSDVAQLGAIGRITMLIGVVSTVLATLIIPRYARLKEEDTRKLRTYFWGIFASVWSIAFMMIAFVWLFSDYLLLILGDKYSGLSYELVLSMTAGALSMVAAFSLALYTSRGWVMNPIISISCSILALTLGIMYLDISTLIGVIKLDIVVAINQLFIHTVYCLYKLYLKRS